VVKVGTSEGRENNGKVPPQTCSGCSVPEPYRSHEWALVRAKPGPQGCIIMNELKTFSSHRLYLLHRLINLAICKEPESV